MSKVRMSKFPVFEYDSMEDTEYGIMWGQFCSKFYDMALKKFPSNRIKVIRLDREVAPEYMWFDPADGVLGAVGDTLRDLYAGALDSHLMVYSLQNRPGMVVIMTDHDHPVNGVEFMLVPCSLRTYARHSC